MNALPPLLPGVTQLSQPACSWVDYPHTALCTYNDVTLLLWPSIVPVLLAVGQHVLSTNF